jgi:hypothetical protein
METTYLSISYGNSSNELPLSFGFEFSILYNRFSSTWGCGMSREGNPALSEYVFKLKKGELELELKSDDAQFIEAQMENWRKMILTQPANQG